MVKVDHFFIAIAFTIFCMNGTAFGFIFLLESFDTLFGLILYYFLSFFSLFCLSIIDEQYFKEFYGKLLYYGNISLFILPIYYFIMSKYLLPGIIIYILQ